MGSVRRGRPMRISRLASGASPGLRVQLRKDVGCDFYDPGLRPTFSWAINGAAKLPEMVEAAGIETCAAAPKPIVFSGLR